METRLNTIMAPELQSQTSPTLESQHLPDLTPPQGWPTVWLCAGAGGLRGDFTALKGTPTPGKAPATSLLSWSISRCLQGSQPFLGFRIIKPSQHFSPILQLTEPHRERHAEATHLGVLRGTRKNPGHPRLSHRKPCLDRSPRGIPEQEGEARAGADMPCHQAGCRRPPGALGGLRWMFLGR